jgi:hypothetical protein
LNFGTTTIFINITQFTQAMGRISLTFAALAGSLALASCDPDPSSLESLDSHIQMLQTQGAKDHAILSAAEKRLPLSGEHMQRAVEIFVGGGRFDHARTALSGTNNTEAYATLIAAAEETHPDVAYWAAENSGNTPLKRAIFERNLGKFKAPWIIETDYFETTGDIANLARSYAKKGFVDQGSRIAIDHQMYELAVDLLVENDQYLKAFELSKGRGFDERARNILQQGSQFYQDHGWALEYADLLESAGSIDPARQIRIDAVAKFAAEGKFQSAAIAAEKWGNFGAASDFYEKAGEFDDVARMQTLLGNNDRAEAYGGLHTILSGQ